MNVTYYLKNISISLLFEWFLLGLTSVTKGGSYNVRLDIVCLYSIDVWYCQSYNYHLSQKFQIQADFFHFRCQRAEYEIFYCEFDAFSKVLLLISSGLAYKLRSGALWRRRHSGVQNDENAPRPTAAQSHEPHAGHEGTYLCRPGSISISIYILHSKC